MLSPPLKNCQQRSCVMPISTVETRADVKTRKDEMILRPTKITSIRRRQD